MKYILTLFLAVSSVMLYGQSAEFNRIEQKIKQAIQKQVWDDVLLLSPDLTIEEPFKGDGYYYTAMAFMKMGDVPKAEQWLAKAETMADEALEKKISALKQDMTVARKAVALQSSALGQQQSGNSTRAASDWAQLWNMDKTNVEYALNAIELYLERKQFVEAMLILEDPVIMKDPASKPLRDQVSKNPAVKTLMSYRQNLKQGKEAMASGNYQTAVSRFSTALTHKPNDSEALTAKREAEDELAWKITNEKNTISDYEAYLNGKTKKSHAARAKQILRNSMLKYGKEYAEKGDIAQMEYYLNKLKSTYALSDADITEANGILTRTYSIEARKLANSKKSYELSTAIDYYGRARSIYPGTAYSLAIDKLEKLRKRYGRPDRTYLAYVYDTVTNFGISIGGLKNRNIGVYITARANSDFFTSGTYFTVDNSGKVDGSVLDDVRATGETKTGYLDGIFGLTKKIAYPLWVYAGGGVTVTNHYWYMAEYFSNGNHDENSWVKNTDESGVKPMAEAGLIIDLSGLHLRGGVKTNDFKDIKNSLLYSVGIGFSFK